MLWNTILLCLRLKKKGLKPKKGRSELKDHWLAFQRVNVTIIDVSVSRFKGQYQCF